MDAKDFTSPGKVAAFLRVFNAWRRGNEVPESKMPHPRDIGMALDAAVQMLERLAQAADCAGSGHAKQQEADHSEPALELVGQAIRAAVEAERQEIIKSIPGGDIVDPQLVCDMIRQRGENQSTEAGG